MSVSVVFHTKFNILFSLSICCVVFFPRLHTTRLKPNLNSPHPHPHPHPIFGCLTLSFVNFIFVSKKILFYKFRKHLFLFLLINNKSYSLNYVQMEYIFGFFYSGFIPYFNIKRSTIFIVSIMQL